MANEELLAGLQVGLFNADTDELITLLSDGLDIPSSSIPDVPITIAVFLPTGGTDNSGAESIGLNLNQGQVIRVESVAPYALFGDSSGNYFGQNNILQLGANLIALDLFTGNGASGTNLGTVTMNFTVSDVPPPDQLTLSIDPNTISENGGSAIATVTRTGDTSNALTVNLSSSDTSEATVPPTVTIDAGQSSATFTIQAVDDALDDGTQAPVITASAPGFADVFSTIFVTDDETPPVTDLEVGLFNADTDQLITLLTDGAVISAEDIAGIPVTIAAIVPDGSIYANTESIRLDLNSGQITKVESVAPYALFGDSSGDYNGQPDILQLGQNNISLELFSDNGASGTLIDTISLNFQIDDTPTVVGEATLSVNLNSNNVQTSNFGDNSFLVTNTGEKDIVKVEIDVTNALFPDSVFDPFGEAGDLTSRQLTINTDGDTGVEAPDHGTSTNPGTAYIGTGGIAGFEGIQLFFDENTNGGFNPGETVGFAMDMDPNSIAGADKTILDSGAVPTWDIGGISGAELIGSTFIVTFADGTTATGQLQGNNNQGGSIGLATQLPAPTELVSLTVNGLLEGGVGTYTDGGPTVIVNGPAGETARIVVAKGIIQPVNNNFQEPYASQLDAQLAALAASDFPANNAAEFQTVDIVLTGQDQDISALFDFTQVSIGEDLAVNEAQVPLGFVASLIDPQNSNLPVGPVSSPIYVQYQAPVPTLTLTIDPSSISENGGSALATVTRNGDTSSELLVSLSSDDTSEATVPNDVTIQVGQSSATFTVQAVDDLDTDGTQTPTITAQAAGFPDATATLDVTDDEAPPAIEIVLINADTDQVITTLTDGLEISTLDLPDAPLTISATVPVGSQFDGQVESMLLDFNEGQATRVESVEPYALFGDAGQGTDFFGQNDLLQIGNNSIAFDLYTGNGATGTVLDTIGISFTVVDGPLNAAAAENEPEAPQQTALPSPVNTAPDGVSDIYNVDENDTLNIDAVAGVLANDNDGDLDALMATLVDDVENGSLSFNIDGSFSYTPEADFNGTDSFTYNVTDGAETSGPIDVTINVNPNPETDDFFV